MNTPIDGFERCSCEGLRIVNMEEKSLDPFERRKAELEEVKGQIFEEQGRRGQYIANGDDIEPPRRGEYIAGADDMDSPRGIELIDNERTTC